MKISAEQLSVIEDRYSYLQYISGDKLSDLPINFPLSEISPKNYDFVLNELNGAIKKLES